MNTIEIGQIEDQQILTNLLFTNSKAEQKLGNLEKSNKLLEETLKKAAEEKIPVMVTELPAFELVGRLYQLGISGMH